MYRQLTAASLMLITGCHIPGWTPVRQEIFKRPSMTALPASPANSCEPPGIPFYLPKPLLVISKNFHHIETPTVGLTDSAPIPHSFDAQSQYAALDFDSNYSYQRDPSGGTKGADGTDGSVVESSAAVSDPTLHSSGAPTVPAGAIPSDGLAPHTFFTYEIVFVPDMTQKYVLQIEGGAGEMRAAMNLVNGWQYTGLGPFYIKDSSTAQNTMARGLAINLGLEGASDLVSSIAEIAPGPGGGLDAKTVRELGNLYDRAARESQTAKFDYSCLPRGVIEKYAEIHVYEAFVDEVGQMQWRPIVGEYDLNGVLRGFQFQREYLGTVQPEMVKADGSAAADVARALADTASQQAETQSRERFDFTEMTPAATSGLITDVVNQTLHAAPANEPEKKGLFHFLHRPRVENRTVIAAPN